MNAGYARGQRLIELGSIAFFALLAVFDVWRLIEAAGLRLPAVTALAAPVAWLAVDALSGLLHWAFDSFGSASTPLIGRSFIRPFRAHHADPEEMTHHDFVETHGASCLAGLPVLAAAGVVPAGTLVEILGQAVLLFSALAALATNQCHKWAHMNEASTPQLVRWAQRRWLILPREHHRLHHTPPFDTHFCMSSGWCNAAFNALLRR